MNDHIDSQRSDDAVAHSRAFDRSLPRPIQEALPDGILVIDGELRNEACTLNSIRADALIGLFFNVIGRSVHDRGKFCR